MSYIAKARELVANRKQEKHNGFTADYFLMFADGTFSNNIKGACHASVLSSPNVRYIITRINWQGDKGCERDLSIQFYDWLINRSPFAKVFVESDATAAWNAEYLIADGRKAGNLVQGAMITTRNPWEYPDLIRQWARMVDEGVNENLAYFLSHFFGSEGDVFFLKAGFTNHKAIDSGTATVEGAVSYAKGVASPTLLTTPLIRNTARVTQVTALWESGSQKFHTYLADELSKMGQAKQAKDCNPFRIKKAENKGKRYEFNRIVKWALMFQESI